MPSLLNFKPLLDTYDPNAGQEDIRQGMKEAAHYASQGIEAAGERGRQREKEFESVFDMDVSKVTDMESKNYIINKYGKLKDKNVAIFDKNKNILGYGKMSPREKIELRSDMDSLKSEAETLKILDNSLVEANDPEKKQWGRELDSEKAEAYSEAKRTGETAKMASLLESLDNPITGNGFIKISDVDVARYATGQVDEARKVMETSKDIVKKQTISGGNTYDTSTAITKFGTSQEASDAIYGVMDNKETGPVLEVNLQRGDWLTDEQKKIAMDENVGTYNYPLLKYYTDEVMDTKPILEEKFETITSTKPKSDYGRSGVKSKTIEKTELGWDYGTFPIKYSGDLNIDGELVNVSGADNIGIEKDGGKYYAKFIVPRNVKAETERLNDKIDKEVSDKYEKEVKSITGIGLGRKDALRAKIRAEIESKYQSKLDDASKKKTIKVPLGDVYDELAPKLEYNKMFLKDFNPDWQSESLEAKNNKETGITYKIGESDYSELDALKMYKNKYPDRSEEEIKVAIQKFKN